MLFAKLGALALSFSSAIAAISEEQIPLDEKTGAAANGDQGAIPQLKIKLTATFPNSEIFGVKLVNGHQTVCQVDIINSESKPIELAFIGGSLLTPMDVPGAPNPPQIVANLTTAKVNKMISGGQTQQFLYPFSVDMHPKDLTLVLQAIIKDQDITYTYPLYNSTVSVVEAPTSIFDPQILFLYLILAAGFGGTCYFIYTTWVTTLFPQTRGRGKGGERAKRSTHGHKKVDPADQVSVVGADGPAVTSGAKAYDERWIPVHHLVKPVAKRVSSGSRPRPKNANGDATSPSS